jgi:beta-lactamase regulating signal transducer with metallopeptidase domain
MPTSALTSLFESFAHSIAPITFTSLWQGLAVTGSLALFFKFAPRISAAHRFALWATAFVSLVLLPLVPSLIFERLGVTTTASSIATPTATHPWLQFDARWSIVLAVAWLIASAARATDLVFHVLRLRHLWCTAIPVDIPTLHQPKRCFEICRTQCLDRPSVIGFFAPRILVPDWLLARLIPGELKQIVLHESEHLRRRDDWTNLFQKLCLVLFPLNPSLVWIDRQLAKEREMACDEAVIRITQAPRAYAACLASLAERGLAHRTEALSLGAWQRRSELVLRVHRILRNRRGLPPIAARVLLAAVGCCLLVVTVELARCPQLVAFVPSARTSQPVDAEAAQLGDAVYPSDRQSAELPRGVYAVQAKAITPAAPFAKAPASRAPQSKTSAVGELRRLWSEPGVRAQNVSVHAAKNTPRAVEAPQQLIVFTAWEQVKTSIPATQTVADYDTAPAAADSNTSSKASSAAAPKSDAAQTPDTGMPAKGQQPNNLTVTRLIFRIVPADSNSSQPTAIPMGWIVIQL